MSELPWVIEHERFDTRSMRLMLSIDSGLAVFNGHFTGRPVLPGVAQIDWSMRFAQSYIGGERPFCGMRQIKFLHIIQPPATVCLDLDWRDDTLLCFGYRAPSGQPVYSSGRLCFA